MRNIVVKAFSIGAIALSLLVFSFTAAGAQPATTPTTTTGGHHCGHGGFLNKILAQLDLTPTQQTTIQGILSAQKTTIQPFISTLKTDRAALKTAAAVVPFDQASVTNAAQKVADDMVPLMVAKMNTKSQIFAVLNSTQQTEFQKLISFAKHRHGGFAQ